MSTRGRPMLTPLPPRAERHHDTPTKASSGPCAHPSGDRDENQVVPFSVDSEGRDEDGEDFESDIKPDKLQPRVSLGRRASMNSDDGGDGDGHFLRRLQSRGRESAWDDTVSRGSAFSSDEEEDEEEDSEKHEGQDYESEPESPSRRNHSSQQSDDEDDNAGEEGEVATSERPSKAIPDGISQPLPASAMATVDLSRLSKLSVFPGSETHLVQGHILRVKTLLSTQYHYFINNQLVLLAEKQMKNRTSNYHLFDMTRSVAVSSKLSKKSGNYVGKLRSNFSKKKNVLVGNFSRKTELGAMVFGATANSSEPRRLTVVLPPLSSKRQEIEGLTVGNSSSSFSMLLDLLESTSQKGIMIAHSPLLPEALSIYENKEPVFENGFYRLNFNGRVSVPSVKNFQLVESNSGSSMSIKNPDRPIFLQFGKVDDKKFHLDFRAPITPIQAFAVALAQFNL